MTKSSPPEAAGTTARRSPPAKGAAKTPVKSTGTAAGTAPEPARGAAGGAAGAKKAAPARKVASKAAPGKESTVPSAKKAAPARPTAPTAPRKATPARPSGARGYASDERFLARQREALEAERATYIEQASSLRAEAQSLVEEMEPGDVQFDEESGEGGTVTVDRERDLALSAQALAAVEEIDDALAKIAAGSYGICEGCGELIPKPRLEALPYARLCISCKAGGLSRR